MFVDLLDVPGSRSAPTPLVGLEFSHSFQWRRLRCFLRLRLADTPVDGDSGFLLHFVRDMGVDVESGPAGDVANDGGQGIV